MRLKSCLEGSPQLRGTEVPNSDPRHRILPQREPSVGITQKSCLVLVIVSQNLYDAPFCSQQMFNWHDCVGEAVKHLKLPFWNSETAPAGPDDNPTSANASVAKSHGPQMPGTSSIRYLAKNVSDYVERNDNVLGDPIEVSVFRMCRWHGIKHRLR